MTADSSSSSSSEKTDAEPKDPGVWMEENFGGIYTLNGPPPTTDEQTGKNLGPFPFRFAGEISEASEADDFVEDFLITKSLSVLYGESNCGKSFLATDISCHVAAGEPWMGREVDRGGVVYVTLEGKAGMDNRILAWKKENGNGELPLAVVTTSLSLLHTDETTRLQLTVEEVSRQVQEMSDVEVKLVVIDTLARAMPGGNENAPEDMGRAVTAADMIKDATGAHVLLVHHTGKDKARGARGHYSLTCAVDTEIEVSRSGEEGVSRVRVTKQRDLERCPDFGFRLDQVVLGENRRGKPITSCVVLGAGSNVIRDRPDGQAGRALEILRELIDREGRNPPKRPVGVPPDVAYVTKDQWRDECRSQGLSVSDNTRAQNQAFSRAYQTLVPDSVGIAGGSVWVK